LLQADYQRRSAPAKITLGDAAHPSDRGRPVARPRCPGR
jgi:hypothetical protein